MKTLVLKVEGIPENNVPLCPASVCPSVQITFQFITTFTTLVPIVDCSSAPSRHGDLTEVCVNFWKLAFYKMLS